MDLEALPTLTIALPLQFLTVFLTSLIAGTILGQLQVNHTILPGHVSDRL